MEPLGGVLAASWGLLAASWGVLGASWGLLGVTWGGLAGSWGLLGASWLRFGGDPGTEPGGGPPPGATDPGTDPGAGALVFGPFQALEAAKTQDCCSKMHVRKCSVFLPPPNYCSAGGMIGKKEKARDTPAAASAVADFKVLGKEALIRLKVQK